MSLFLLSGAGGLKQRKLAALVSALAIFSSCSLLFRTADDAGGGGAADSGGTCSAPPAALDVGLIVLPCGETELQLPSLAEALALSECPVEKVRWTLSKRLSESLESDLFSFTGGPDDKLPLETRVLGGTFAQPIFNLTSYHGPTLGRVRIDKKVTGIDQLFQDFGPITDGTYAFRIAVASTTRESVRARLFETGSSNGNPSFGIENLCVGIAESVSGACETSASLTSFVAELPLTSSQGKMAKLRFSLGGDGIYYFDLASLGPAGTQDNQLADASFNDTTSGANTPWSLSCVTLACVFDEIPIPMALEEYGEYVLRVATIADDGTESEETSSVISHQACPEPL